MVKNIFKLGILTVIIIIFSVTNYINIVYNIDIVKSIIHFIPVIIVLILLIGFYKMFFRKENLILIFSIILLIGLFISSSIGNSVNSAQRKAIFKESEDIVIALNNYYKDNNLYPKDLKELVPKYISEIKKVKTTYDGEADFEYFLIDGGKSYNLGFEQYRNNGNGWYEEG